MATPERTPEGKFKIYSVATGQRFERWPVDAMLMLDTGAYTADPPISAGHIPETAPVAPGSEIAAEEPGVVSPAAPVLPPPIVGPAGKGAPVQLPRGRR